MPHAHQKSSDADEKQNSGRRWTRYPVDAAPILVTSGNTQFEAVVVDESIGGIGIKTNEMVALVAGQVIDLLYHGANVRGHVSAVVPSSRDCRISISWEKNATPAKEVEEDQVAFVEVGPLVVICQKHEVGSADCHSVTLWDGKQFEVPGDRLTFRTKRARMVELQTMGEERSMTARLYGLDSQGNPHAVTRRILDFEFGG